jgi:hypothetical protein
VLFQKFLQLARCFGFFFQCIQKLLVRL